MFAVFLCSHSLWVDDGHLHDKVSGELEQLGVVPAGLEQEGEHVEAAAGGFPALLHTDLAKGETQHQDPLELMTEHRCVQHSKQSQTFFKQFFVCFEFTSIICEHTHKRSEEVVLGEHRHWRVKSSNLKWSPLD